jgi:hypothetical protein
MAAKWTSEQNATGRVWSSFLFAAKLSASDPTALSNDLSSYACCAGDSGRRCSRPAFYRYVKEACFGYAGDITMSGKLDRLFDSAYTHIYD